MKLREVKESQTVDEMLGVRREGRKEGRRRGTKERGGGNVQRKRCTEGFMEETGREEEVKLAREEAEWHQMREGHEGKSFFM